MPTLLELFESKKILGMNNLMDTAQQEADLQKVEYRKGTVASDGGIIDGPIRSYNTLQIQGGKTAAFIYDINKRPFTQISTDNVFLNNTSVPLLNKLKKSKIANKGGESVTEEELTGLRPFRLLSMPVLYGTELPIIVLGESKSTKKQKIGTFSYEGALPGKAIDNKKNTPTNLFLLDAFRNGKTTEYPKLFSNLTGTPEQLFMKLITNPIQAIKNVLTIPKTPSNSNSTDNTLQFILDVKNKNTFLFNFWVRSYDTDRKYSDISNGVYPENTEVTERYDLSSKLNQVLTDVRTPNLLLGPDGFDIKDKVEKKVGKRRYYEDKGNPGSKIYGGSDDNNLSLSDVQLKGRFHIGESGLVDTINQSVPFTEGSETKDKDGIGISNRDFIPLKFTSIERNKSVVFRATVSGLSETFTPSWESSKFVGNPFSLYTYGGIERTLTFTFKVYSTNLQEHMAGWERLSFLSSLVYSQGFSRDADSSKDLLYTIPPFIKFTLGNMYKSKVSFIESLTYTVDDNTPWEIGLENTPIEPRPTNTDGRTKNQDYMVPGITSFNKDAIGFKLPKIIEVAMTLKMVETPKTVYNFYDEETTDDKGAKVTIKKAGFNDLYGYSKSTPPPKVDDNAGQKNGKTTDLTKKEDKQPNAINTPNSTITPSNASSGGSAMGASGTDTNKFGQNETNSTRNQIIP